MDSQGYTALVGPRSGDSKSTASTAIHVLPHCLVRSKMKGVTCFVVVFSMIYSTIVMMVSSVRNSFGLGGMDGHHNIHQRVSIKHREKLFYQSHVKGLRALLNLDDDTKDENSQGIVLDWLPILDDFDIHQLPPHNQSTDNKYDLVRSDNLCSLVRAYTTFRHSVVAEPKPHVAWWRDSKTTRNKNGEEDEDTVAEWLEQGCSVEDIEIYLDHPDTIALMITHNATGVQALHNHPKIRPLSPIGLWQHRSSDTARASLWEAIQALPHQGSNNSNRTTILLLGDEEDRRREASTYSSLEQKFTSYKLHTVFPPLQNSTKTLWDPLRNTQFVLPITKRQRYLEVWVSDALLLGAVPILEDNAWYQTVLEGLPIIWVTHYANLDPELLQLEWEEIIAQPGHFQYNRLTQSYWVNRAVKALAG